MTYKRTNHNGGCAARIALYVSNLIVCLESTKLAAPRVARRRQMMRKLDEKVHMPSQDVSLALI